MDPEKSEWRRAWELAEAWLDLDPAEVARRLAKLEDEEPDLAGKVRSLLERAPNRHPSPLEGTRIDGYVIERLIGRGGMGAVFQARSLDLDRTVALKLLLNAVPTQRDLERFKREAIVQAELSHPNIAQLHEAGTWRDDAGRSVPWLAMQLVPAARTVDSYVTDEDLVPRDVARLFAAIAEAVAHAHDRGVLHRDIKPSNILIAENGQPFVIDFGTARLVEAAGRRVETMTSEGQVLGTLPYMAPEQLAADTASRPASYGMRADVFSLGLVLHELVAGEERFDRPKGLLDAQAWRTRYLKPPRSRLHVLGHPRELEWIVAKATAADAARRYSNASELAEDLRRFLADRPVNAGPETVGYRAKLFVRRNRVAVAAAAFVLVVSSAAALFSGLSKLGEVRAESRMILSEAEKARAYEVLRDALQMLETRGIVTGEGPVSVAAALKLSIDQNFGEEKPPWQVYEVLARALRGEREGAGALEACTEALHGAMQDGTATTAELFDLRRLLALAYADTGDIQRAGIAFDALIEDAERVGASLQGELMADHGAALRTCGQYDAALPILLAALEHSEAVEDEATALRALENLGELFNARGKYGQAIEHLTSARRRSRERLGSVSRTTLSAEGILGLALSRNGRAAEAVEVLLPAKDLADKNYPKADHTRIGILQSLSTAYEELGQSERAVPLREEVYSIRSERYGVSSQWAFVAAMDLAIALQFSGHRTRARHLCEDLVASEGRIFPASEPQYFEARRILASVLQDEREFERAIELAREAHEGLKNLDRDPAPRITCLAIIAGCLQSLGRLDEAEEVYVDALEQARSELHPQHPITAALKGNYGDLLTTRNPEAEQALVFHREALKASIDAGAGSSVNAIISRSNIAFVLLGQRRPQEALPVLQEAESLIRPETRRQLLAIHINLFRAYAELGEDERALEQARLVIENAPSEDPRYLTRLRELAEGHDLAIDGL